MRKPKTQKPDNGYFIHNFPADLKTQAQHRAIDEKLNLKELILKALRLYLDSK